MTLQPFETKARAIDHLGRGQIADCPTAVSELWKNSYDAYARHADLHIFDGTPCIASIFDDGHGMSADDFLTRWMVIGTESKLNGAAPSLSERNGLPERPRQGEKGIGRLSAAFLGPVTLLISKRRSRFVVGLVDWRLFENPYLTLSDVCVPVEEFSDKHDLVDLLPQMFAQSVQNLKGGESNDRDVASAWRKYSSLEQSNNCATTAAKIEALESVKEVLTERIISNVLPHWTAWTENKSSGTALLVLDAGAELAVWVEPDRDDDEYEEVRRLLLATLTGFVDPYTERQSIDFSYNVIGAPWRQAEHCCWE